MTSFWLLGVIRKGLVLGVFHSREYTGGLLMFSWHRRDFGIGVLSWQRRDRWPDPNWALLNIGADGLCILGWWIIDRRAYHNEGQP